MQRLRYLVHRGCVGSLFRSGSIPFFVYIFHFLVVGCVDSDGGIVLGSPSSSSAMSCICSAAARYDTSMVACEAFAHANIAEAGPGAIQ